MTDRRVLGRLEAEVREGHSECSRKGWKGLRRLIPKRRSGWDEEGLRKEKGRGRGDAEVGVAMVGEEALTGWLDGSGRRGVELVRRRDVPISSGDNYVCTKRKDMSQSAAVIKIVL
jgi:hypothetical protein